LRDGDAGITAAASGRYYYKGVRIMCDTSIHERAAELLADLPAGGRVLDVPAGGGALTLRLCDMGLQAEGGDLFPDLFQAQGLICHRVDMNEEMPFEPDSFDAIVSVEGVEHLENPFLFVRECNRVLKPGGRLLVTTPNLVAGGGRLRFFLTGFYTMNTKPLNKVTLYPAFDHISPRTYPQLRHMLHTNGFKLTYAGSIQRRRRNAWFYVFYPLVWAHTSRALRKEPDDRQRAINREIMRDLLSPDLLLGKSLMLVAEKVGGIAPTEMVKPNWPGLHAPSPESSQ